MKKKHSIEHGVITIIEITLIVVLCGVIIYQVSSYPIFAHIF